MAFLHLNFRSDCISRSVYPVVFLPDYNLWRDIDPPYPTLYFLPGYSGGGLETSMFSNFALFAMRFGVAVILADGENSFYTDDEPRAALFSRYVGEELVQVTRDILPLSRRREDTFIGGISMGGYGALINGLRFPERFSKIAMLSPALSFKQRDDQPPPGCPVPAGELTAVLGTWQEYMHSYRDYEYAAEQAAQSPAAMPALFLGCGTEDPLIAPARDFAARMESLGVPLTWHEAAGGHDHRFWKQALAPLFCFLTGKEDA